MNQPASATALAQLLIDHKDPDRMGDASHETFSELPFSFELN